MTTDTAENWRYVPDTDNMYAVSDLGRVYSYRRGGRYLKPGRMSGGHFSVAFGRNNSRCVHEIVLTTFVGPAPEGHEARHLDDNKAHNALPNLEWATYARNIQDKKWFNLPRGYKITGEQSREIKALLASGEKTQRQIATLYGVCRTTIQNIAYGRIHTDV